jgi:hypothetical protein
MIIIHALIIIQKRAKHFVIKAKSVNNKHIPSRPFVLLASLGKKE